MRTTKKYEHVAKLNLHAEIRICPDCAQRLYRFETVSCRTIITLNGPIYVVHQGYHCVNPACLSKKRVYRSAAATALALPGFTFGLDIIIWLGHLRFAEHYTEDQAHQALLECLGKFNLSVSRREILYLFVAYETLLSVAAQTQDTEEFRNWRTEVVQRGGLIISIDGIQPDKGGQTVYLVRDVLSGRMLNAALVTVADVATMKSILAPIHALDLPVIGTISDAQRAEVLALSELWPDAPHQLCQFHYLRQASLPIQEVDRKLKLKMRHEICSPLRHQIRKLQINQQKEVDIPEEKQQLDVLADYAMAMQEVLYEEGKPPFEYAGVRAYEGLTQIEASLEELVKKGVQKTRGLPTV